MNSGENLNTDNSEKRSPANEVDVFAPGGAKYLATIVRQQIDEECEAAAPPKMSWRIQPSALGDDCVAALWFKFRWVIKKQTQARMTRLFGRGHDEEEKLVFLLRRNGWTVEDIDPARAEKEIKQWNVKDFGGHLSAYLDAKMSHPVFTKGVKILGEFKTFNDKRFKAWVAKGVKLSDPKYYVQACLYMYYQDLPWCLMVGVNKNDDDIEYEVILRDDATARDAIRKGETILNSQSRPPRIAENPAFFKCKTCDFQTICHYSAPVLKNCRSCEFAFPVEGGGWFCSHPQNGLDIPTEVIPNGCHLHNPIV